MSLRIPDVDLIQFDEIAQLHPIALKLPYIRSEKNGYFSLLGNDGVLDYTIINEKRFLMSQWEVSLDTTSSKDATWKMLSR